MLTTCGTAANLSRTNSTCYDWKSPCHEPIGNTANAFQHVMSTCCGSDDTMIFTSQILAPLVEGSTGLEGIQITETNHKEALTCHAESLYQCLTTVSQIQLLNAVIFGLLQRRRSWQWHALAHAEAELHQNSARDLSKAYSALEAIGSTVNEKVKHPPSSRHLDGSCPSVNGSDWRLDQATVGGQGNRRQRGA